MQCFGANSLAIPLPSGENNVALLRMGEEHLAVLRKDGTIGYWYNSTYQEDFGTPPSGNDFSAIGTSKCAMRTDGTTTCWGRDRRGGQARRNDGQAITEVALGVNGGYFLRADGSIRAWGVNYPAPSGTGYTQLVADAGNHYCALKPADNEAVCWGAEGPPTITPAAGPFTQLASASGPELANEFFKYEGTFCGLRTNGTLACWGTNTNKQATMCC